MDVEMDTNALQDLNPLLEMNSALSMLGVLEV